MTLSFVPKKSSSKMSVKSGLVKTRVMASATCVKEFVKWRRLHFTSDSYRHEANARVRGYHGEPAEKSHDEEKDLVEVRSRDDG